MIFTTQTISYTYDKLNQLTSVSNYGNLGLDGSSIEYFYDDGQLEFEEYRKASGAVERVHKYYYDDDGIVRFLQVIGSDGLSSSGRYNVYAYVYDGNGNITDLVRVRQLRNLWTYSDATPVAHYEYDAYGNILSETCSDNAAKYNPIKYKGYYYESDTKMYRLDSRYYDPLIGRFLNADDPSLLTESPNALTDKNLYNYCDNNPVMRKDSDGEFWHVVVGAVIGGGLEAIDQVMTSGKITSLSAIGIAAAGGGLSAALGPILSCAVSGGTNVVVDVVKNGFYKNGNKNEGIDAKRFFNDFAVGAGLSFCGAQSSKVVTYGPKAAKAMTKDYVKKLFRLKNKKTKSKSLQVRYNKWKKRHFSRKIRYRERTRSVLSSLDSASLTTMYSGSRRR